VLGIVLALVPLAAGAVGAVLGLRVRPEQAPTETVQPQTPLLLPPRETAAPRTRPAAPAVTAEPAVTVKPKQRRQIAGDTDAFMAELELLQRAHSAYSRDEFSRALALVREHARRFPSGRLAEEREALRLRSLLGTGRTQRANRTAAAFAVRFPRSVLLPRIHDREGEPK